MQDSLTLGLRYTASFGDASMVLRLAACAAGTAEEMLCPGGEAAFVKQMVLDSLTLSLLYTAILWRYQVGTEAFSVCCTHCRGDGLPWW